jgi:hypothetical protein
MTRLGGITESGRSLAMIGVGGIMALAPVSFQAVGARTLSLGTQGLLALALGLGAYLGQLVGAWVVEARLASPPSRGGIPYPVTLLVLSVAGGAVLLVAPLATVAYAVGVPILVAGLNVGRLVSVSREDYPRELAAGVILLAGVAVAAVRSFAGVGSVRAITLACLLAILVRFHSTREPRKASPSARAGVTAETAMVGMVQPLLNALLLAVVGPSAAIAFRILSTVSAAMEPVTAYVRVRLLVAWSRIQVLVGAAAMLALFALVMTMAWTGAFRAILGAAWDHVPLAALVLACLWRASGFITTIPFAELRRQGRTTQVFWLRVASSLWYALVAVPVSLTGSTVLLFAALLAADLTCAAVYFAYARRAAAAEARTVSV